MRVLVVTHAHPQEEVPGHQAFVHDQVEALRALPGLEVTLETFRPGGRRYLSTALALRRLGRRERFDVVHAHHGLSGWSALGYRGAPEVVTFHGTDVRHRWVGRLSRLLARRVALAATASPELRRELPGARAVLPTGVDLERFRPLERSAARERLGLAAEGRYLLFPSDPARTEKRHDRAEQLAARHPEAELLTLGGISSADVPLHVNAADAVLQTSEREGFGLPVIEALACDVPVLSTPVGIAPLALEGVQGTHCGPFDAERWSAALAPLLAQPDPRVAGRSRAALFERGRMAERVAAAYHDVLGLDLNGDQAAEEAARNGSHQRP